ncbi:MAG TPA: tetratricopeptide repeat protein [Thermoanaerobaculia bacterium]|nr:tetratricopeptide repeat protein [Thermoanaerobaculia bacterium]
MTAELLMDAGERALAMQGGTRRIVEAPRGRGRQQWIEEQLAEAHERGCDALAVSCRLETHGAWGGVADLFRTLVPAIDAAAPELVRAHSYALALTIPELRRRFPMANASLTDSGPVKERVRSYPVDRAYRLVHGLIDLLSEWLPRNGRRLVLVCDGFDGAGALGSRFFRELVRRRLDRLPLELIFVVDEGVGEVAAAMLDEREATIERLAIGGPEEAVDGEAMERRIGELEHLVLANIQQSENYLPLLIHLCMTSGQSQRALHWRSIILVIYNHYGFYEDALTFGEALVPHLDEPRTSAKGSFTRWQIVSGLFNAMVAIGRAEDAYRLVHDEALTKCDAPNDLVSIYYTMAMLHCRFLPKKDLAKAEEFLDKSLAVIEHTTLSENEKHYLAVFALNGVAFIRHLQGRVEEAAKLCREGFERLNLHLTDEEYRLHRSVLLYNIAQVHTSTRNYEEALSYYGQAMEIDPRYSEYYNDRGSVYLKMGRFAEAAEDYRKATELSEPYHEVYTNLGQAYNLAGDAEKAIAAYTNALDLAPRQLLPHLGRAQAYESLGRNEEALADYTAALALDSSDGLVWANRAVLHYENGRLEAAVADLDQAITRAPAVADLYANRAVALRDLGRLDDAARDEEMSRQLQA